MQIINNEKMSSLTCNLRKLNNIWEIKIKLIVGKTKAILGSICQASDYQKLQYLTLLAVFNIDGKWYFSCCPGKVMGPSH